MKIFLFLLNLCKLKYKNINKNKTKYAYSTILKVAVTHNSEQDVRCHILSVFFNCRSQFKNPSLDEKNQECMSCFRWILGITYRSTMHFFNKLITLITHLRVKLPIRSRSYWTLDLGRCVLLGFWHIRI